MTRSAIPSSGQRKPKFFIILLRLTTSLYIGYASSHTTKSCKLWKPIESKPVRGAISKKHHHAKLQSPPRHPLSDSRTAPIGLQSAQSAPLAAPSKTRASTLTLPFRTAGPRLSPAGPPLLSSFRRRWSQGPWRPLPISNVILSLLLPGSVTSVSKTHCLVTALFWDLRVVLIARLLAHTLCTYCRQYPSCCEWSRKHSSVPSWKFAWWGWKYVTRKENSHVRKWYLPVFLLSGALPGRMDASYTAKRADEEKKEHLPATGVVLVCGGGGLE